MPPTEASIGVTPLSVCIYIMKHAHVCVCVYMYVCMCVGVWVWVWVCIRVSAHVCLRMCDGHVCVIEQHTHTYTHHTPHTTHRVAKMLAKTNSILDFTCLEMTDATQAW